jgi:uncharacterized protein (TIGR02118 family)
MLTCFQEEKGASTERCMRKNGAWEWFHLAKTEGGSIMSKVIFVLYRRSDLSREQMAEQWSGQQHTSIVSKLPGLTRWVQNHVTSAPSEPICDGVGELWFDSDEAMQQALSSPEMGAAVEDARRFLDMEKTGLILVEEKSVIGL